MIREIKWLKCPPNSVDDEMAFWFCEPISLPPSLTRQGGTEGVARTPWDRGSRPWGRGEL